MPWDTRLLVVALILLPLVSLAAEPPPLVFEAPARFAPLAARLEKLNPHAIRAAMELVGLQEPGPPVSITLAPEDSQAARHAPPWVSGYALVPSGHIVIFPDRQISYPYGSLEGVLLHELTHVFVMRVIKGHTGPRWFAEGLATVASGERDLEDRTWGFWIELIATRTSLEEIDRWFGEGPPAVHKAYLLAEAFVRYLIASFGPDTPRRMLREHAAGVSLEEAARAVTGRSLRELENEFWSQQFAWQRWIPAVTSSAILWMIIVLLSLAALRKQRQRAAAMKRQWEEEDNEL
ncbi:MAG TPA: hypothetical protein VJ692_13200 [Nitrospiraceae bacterium]|nr:hypothetical protein [Nitrospiraceae bacterium]